MAKKTDRTFRKVLNQRRLLAIIIVAIAVTLVLYGGHGLWQRYRTTHDAHPTVAKTVITKSTSQPDETPPTNACANYKVAPNDPQRIDITSVNAHGCIEQVSVTKQNAIAVPDNIYTAAWYTRSVLPGQPGLSVILGHISGRYKVDGIFEHLASLKSGDTFTVTRGDGTILHYRVVQEQSVPLAQAVQVLLTKNPTINSQLNVITCGGQYDKSKKLYDHRIIVSTELITN